MQSLSLETFSEFVGNLYQGPLENIPWTTFLNRLNVYLQSKFVTFILRPPSPVSYTHLTLPTNREV